LRQYPFAKKLQSQTVSREKLCKTLLYEKAASKLLVQLTPGVDFTNGLPSAFTHTDPKSSKRY
jgi:hypothetical protein